MARDLDLRRDEIQQVLEQDIVGAYEYQAGQLKLGLRKDKTLLEAERILNTEGEYQSVLNSAQTAKKLD